MTTPAIARDDSRLQDGYHEQYNPATGETRNHYAVTQRRVYRETELRPESVSHPKDASGWRAPGSFFHTGTSSTPQPAGSFRTRLSYQPWMEVYGDGDGWSESVFGLPYFPYYLEGVAVNKALLALKSDTPGLVQNFIERKQAEDLTIHVCNLAVATIGKFINAWKHKFKPKYLMQATVKSLKASLREENTRQLLNDFLQVQYGVRPGMGDVYDAVDLIRKQSDTTPRVTVHGKSGDRIQGTWFKQSSFGYVGYVCDTLVTHNCHVRLDFCLDNPLLTSLSQAGITNPVDLIWEEIPFSFVVDWFVPVGNYLSALDATLGWKFLGGSISKISRSTAKADQWRA